MIQRSQNNQRGGILSTEMLIFFIKLDEDKAYWYKDDRNIELELGS